MDKIKIAFIGYGRHAKLNLYPSLRHLGYNITAVATQHEETSLQAGTEQNIPHTYTDFRKMIETEKPDATVIAVPAEKEFEVAKEAMNLGTNVFVEKPAGMNSQEAQELVDVSNATGRSLMVGYMKRFAPIHVKAKEFLSRKEFGTPLAVNQFFTCRNFAKSPREYLLFAGIHYIDLLRYYLGDVQTVKGETFETQGMLMQAFTLKFQNGAIGTLQYGGCPSWSRGAQEMTITGENQYIKIVGIDKLSLSAKTQSGIPGWQTIEEKEENYTSMLSTSGGGLQALYLNGFVGEIKHFLESIQNGKQPINSAQDNLETMKLIDMMLESISAT